MLLHLCQRSDLSWCVWPTGTDAHGSSKQDISLTLWWSHTHVWLKSHIHIPLHTSPHYCINALQATYLWVKRQVQPSIQHAANPFIYDLHRYVSLHPCTIRSSLKPLGKYWKILSSCTVVYTGEKFGPCSGFKPSPGQINQLFQNRIISKTEHVGLKQTQNEHGVPPR